MELIDELRGRAYEVISQFVDLRKGSGGWTGKCPFHDDDRPSFSLQTNGHWKCFGACDESGDVFDFVKKREELSDFPSAKRRVAELLGVTTARQNADQHRGRSPGKIVTAYDYPDAGGKLIFQVCRLDPKDFRQRRPDGRGGWIWDLEGVERVLYRLPEVLAADEVWVTEGEKDADAAARLGLDATTASGGASQRWEEGYTEALVGKRVLVCGDTDPPGRKHAAKIVDALQGRAAEVVDVVLPPPHKDLSDFIAAGNGPSDLAGLATAARAAADRPWPVKVGIPLLTDIENEPIEWLVKDLIPAGGFSLLAGPPGSFKSTLALDIARAVSNGESLSLLEPAEPREVLYIDRENSQIWATEKRRLLSIVDAPRLRWWGRKGRHAFSFGDPSFERWVEEVKPLLIFDSLVRFLNGADENSNTEVSAVMANFLTLKDLGATILLLAHSSASKSADKLVRGATEIEAAPDVCLRCDRHANDARRVMIHGFKGRFAPERSIELRLTRECGFESLGHNGGASSDDERQEDS